MSTKTKELLTSAVLLASFLTYKIVTVETNTGIYNRLVPIAQRQ